MDWGAAAGIISASVAALVAVGSGFRWVFAQASRRCDDCCTERDKLRLANDEALLAFRRRDAEERVWEREQRAARGSVGGTP